MEILAYLFVLSFFTTRNFTTEIDLNVGDEANYWHCVTHTDEQARCVH